MSHCISQAADKILDKKFKVLDKGFVRLVDYLGDDSRIVAAARVSYGRGRCVSPPACSSSSWWGLPGFSWSP